MSELDFIEDRELRHNIKSAIQYSYLLPDCTKDENDEDFKTETYRVIVLYAASIIEAILLYVYKKRGKPLMITEYKHARQVDSQIRHEACPTDVVVIAVQIKRKADEREMTLDKLVAYFLQEKLMTEKVAGEVIEIKDVRNTFHLSKSRDGIACDIAAVEKALRLLVHIIERAPLSLRA